MLTQFDIDQQRETARQQALAGAISSWGEMEKEKQTKRREALNLQANLRAQGYDTSLSDIEKHFDGPKEPGILDKAKAFVLGQKQPEAEAPANIYANRTQEWKDARANDAEARTYARNKEEDATKFERKYKLDDQNLRRQEMGLKYRQNDLENQKTLAEIEALKAKNNPKANLRQLSATEVGKYNEGNQIPTILNDIETVVSGNKDMFGPVSGRLSSLNPYNEKAKTMDAQLLAAAQTVGKFLEGGVLRAEDIPKYRKMLPDLSDSPEVAANKLAAVRRLLITKQNSDISALKGAGYDVSSIDKGFVAPELPGIVTGKQGVTNNANANAGGGNSGPWAKYGKK